MPLSCEDSRITSPNREDRQAGDPNIEYPGDGEFVIFVDRVDSKDAIIRFGFIWPGVMRHKKIIVGIVILSVLAVFILQNTEIVTIQFLFWHFGISRALMIFLVFALGILLGWFLRSIYRVVRR